MAENCTDSKTTATARVTEKFENGELTTELARDNGVGSG
jgi:hypothetical protein